eukprot:TRINITY_DN1214_c0_g1_i13.p1 TRINITY_DN1214_c0_g1~~TRINITY_DN1214_c0_g1_i13.p1  ORF type:complete len:540 (-),score=95.20 TRINITY_DN1214_c0_g1_i13:122-1741(-)
MFAFLSLFLTIALCVDDRVFLEQSSSYVLPTGWRDIGTPHSTEVISLTFVLEVRNSERLRNDALRVSDPDSKFYTKYLTFEEIISRYAPEKRQLDLLVNWLTSHGIKRNQIRVTPTRDFVSVDLPVVLANRLFKISLRKYQHQLHGTVIKTTLPYSVPKHLSSVVSFVSGLVRFPNQPAISPVNKLSTKRQGGLVTPTVIWQTFKTGGLHGTNFNNTQAVAQFLGQYYAPSDLSTFSSQYSLPTAHVTVVGENDPTNSGGEATLDIEYITATAPGVSTYFWSTSGLHQGQERFVIWAEGLNQRASIPWVHSASYGDVESSITSTYAERLESEFHKLALRGVTVLFSSGDSGVGCTDSCVNSPIWPASSPFVTAVGGFDASLIGDVISSGGFSNYFSQPTWQKSAVSNYLATNNNLPPSNQYNVTGRAMPDVSSFSENVYVYQQGWGLVGGTSCASPVFAGVLTLINDALLNAGKKTVGAINPAIYKIGTATPSAFIDITSGNNQNGCCNGFNCQAGWDPVTGWGAPNFPVLRQAFASLQ